MKKQVRIGVFETNSSSTHSLVVCTKEEYDKWKSGELLYVRDFYPIPKEEHPTSKFVTPEQAQKLQDKGVDDYEIRNFNSWNTEHEEDVHEYTTKSGEEIMIRCYFGYDG